MHAPALRGRLFWKYLAVILLLVGGVLTLSTAIDLYFSYEEAKENIVELEREKAYAAAYRIEQFMTSVEREVVGLMSTAAVESAAMPSQSGTHGAAQLSEQRYLDYLRVLRNVPAITALRHLDSSGAERLSVSVVDLDAVNSGKNYSTSPEFLVTQARKRYFSPMFLRNKAEPYMLVAVAVAETAPEITVAEISLNPIWDVVSRLRVGRAGYAYVVDAGGRLIAHPDMSIVLQNRDLSDTSQVKAARLEGKAEATGGASFTAAEGLGGRKVLAVSVPIPHLHWLVFIEQPLDEVLDSLRTQLWRAAALMVLGLALSVLASVLLARRMVAPIRQLQEGAARVGKGELDHRIDIHTGDELEALAAEFNHTTAQLQDSQSNLEQKVEARTADLTQSLEQQTATAEVLKVISASPTDVQPVFDIIGKLAERLCAADLSLVSRFDGELIQLVACHGVDEEGEEAVRRAFPMRPDSETVTARAFRNGAVEHVADVLADPSYEQKYAARASGYRACLGVPMVREGQVIGVIFVGRRTPGYFTDAKVDLLKTFADQAVIAIENVRLFKEVEARTEALTRSVEEMRALGEVGQAVSSTLDLDTVLMTIITHAVELSKADAGGTIYEFDEVEGVFVPRASHGMSEAMVAGLRDSRIRIGETSLGKCAEQRAPFQMPDIGLMSEGPVRDLLLREDVRAVLAVPLLRDERVIGGLVIRRKVAGEFSPSVVTLLQTLAGQSVLAIQNARLFREIAEKGKQLEVASQLKSQFLANMSHELRTPLNAIIGVTEMLHEDAVDLKRDDQLEPLERVLRAAKHLLALINDILDLSKIEAGKMDIHIESFAIAPLIEDVVQTIGTMATKNGNQVVVDCAADLGTMRADQTRIRQALLNLASNANKFTEKGTVTIGARRGIEAGREWVTMAVTRHRHRPDARADGEALPGLRPGRRLDHPQVRRHGTRPGDQPALLPDDGRRHHGGERAGQGLDLHHPAARRSRGRAARCRGQGCRGRPARCGRRRCADDPGGGRRSDRARGHRAASDARGLCGGDRQWRPGGTAPRARAAPRRDHARCDDAGPGRLDGAGRDQGRSGACGHSGHSRVHRGREDPRLRAGGHRLHGQAGRSRAAFRCAAQHLRRGGPPGAAGRRRRHDAARHAARAGKGRLGGRRGGERPGGAGAAGRSVSRRHHARSDDAGDGRLRVPGRDAGPGRVARYSGAGGDRQGPDGGGAQPPQRRRGARAAEGQRRAGRDAGGDQPCSARLDRARPGQEGRRGNGMKILYVEDNEDNIYMLERRLKRAGFDVVIARDGAQGVAMAHTEQPELILMDMGLPVLDGAQATSQIKAAPETKHIPVIALTANAMTGDREKALAAGCDDFDTKPVELPRLLGKIQALAPGAPGGQTA